MSPGSETVEACFQILCYYMYTQLSEKRTEQIINSTQFNEKITLRSSQLASQFLTSRSFDYDVYVSIGILHCAFSDLRASPKINGMSVSLPVPLNVFVNTHTLAPVLSVDLDNCFGLDEHGLNSLTRLCPQYASVYSAIFSSAVHILSRSVS